MGHKPFAVIADFLSRNGIAVLRYDDRGVAGSKGSFAGSTTLDFADDAEAAFGYLSARPEVDPKRVGIMGHSEGGLIAPIVAARNPAVDFIVLLAGPGVRGDRLILAQGDAISKAAGADPARTAWANALNAKLYQIIEQPGDPAANAAAAKDAFLAGIDSASTLTDQERQTARAQVDSTVAQLSSPWFRLFLTLDPATYLSRVTVPVLALNGTLDLQVPPGPRSPGHRGRPHGGRQQALHADEAGRPEPPLSARDDGAAGRIRQACGDVRPGGARRHPRLDPGPLTRGGCGAL